MAHRTVFQGKEFNIRRMRGDTLEDKQRQLEEIAAQISSCQRCPLWRTRKNPVPGEGPASWVVFIGEAPGAREDELGRPFVGSAGKFLDELLSVAGLERGQVFITNVVKCRPPSNRVPRSAELSACYPFLQRQLSAISPRLVCTLGGVALRSVLGLSGINRYRGRPQMRGSTVYFPTLHPAASLYDRKLREILVADFERLGELVQAGPDGLASKMASLNGLLTLDSF